MADILIDELTNCLVLRETNEEIGTSYKTMTKKLTTLDVQKMHQFG